MAKLEQNDLTKMLAAWADGDKDALDRVISVLYPEFRRIARQTLGRRAGESLESAALANEVYLKLISAGTIQCENRTHFLALCAQMSRRILVDHARREECESVAEMPFRGRRCGTAQVSSAGSARSGPRGANKPLHLTDRDTLTPLALSAIGDSRVPQVSGRR